MITAGTSFRFDSHNTSTSISQLFFASYGIIALYFIDVSTVFNEKSRKIHVLTAVFGISKSGSRHSIVPTAAKSNMKPAWMLRNSPFRSSLLLSQSFILYFLKDFWARPLTIIYSSLN